MWSSPRRLTNRTGQDRNPEEARKFGDQARATGNRGSCGRAYAAVNVKVVPTLLDV